jgi:hypothetical protein
MDFNNLTRQHIFVKILARILLCIGFETCASGNKLKETDMNSLVLDLILTSLASLSLGVLLIAGVSVLNRT